MDRDPVSSRYAAVERERRFLADALPGSARTPIRISDRYLTGSMLRLRRMEAVDDPTRVVFKLAQKVRIDDADPKRVMLTNMYITEAEHERLTSVPAAVLRKTRYSIGEAGRRVAVDVFEGPLTGLILIEADFASDEEMAAFEPPSFAGPEVSNDDRFSGGRLASTGAEELQILLAQ